MTKLTELLRSQYTSDRHVIAGLGDQTTTAGKASGNLFGRLVQNIERSLSAEVRQRNRAGVDAYIAQIRTINSELADVANRVLADTRAQGKPLTVRLAREVGGRDLSQALQQQASALSQDFFARGVFGADGQWHGSEADDLRLTALRQSIEMVLAHLPEDKDPETSAALLSLAHKFDRLRGKETGDWVVPAQRISGKGQQRVQVFNTQAGKLIPTSVTHAQWHKLNAAHAQFEAGQTPSTDDRSLRASALALIQATGAHRGLRFIQRAPTPALVELARAVGHGVYTEFDQLHELQAEIDAQALDTASLALLKRYNADHANLDSKLQFAPTRAHSELVSRPSDPNDPVAQTPPQVRQLRRFFAECLSPTNPLDLQLGSETERLKSICQAHPGVLLSLMLDPVLSQNPELSGVPEPALQALGSLLTPELAAGLLACDGPQAQEKMLREHLAALPASAFAALDQGIQASMKDIEPQVNEVMGQLSQGFGSVPGNLAKFLSEAFKRYYAGQSPADQRAMLASYMRQAVPASPKPQALAALIQGAGPLMIKMLQMVGDKIGNGAEARELREALAFVKTDLPSIHPDLRNAMMAAVIEDSQGGIVALKEVRSLGAASVGETFLVNVEKADGSTEQVVLKLLRPGIQERGGRERRFMDAVAQIIPGMAGTFAGIVDQIEGEMDLRTEAANVRLGQVYTDAGHPDVKSMTLSGIGQERPFYMIAQKAPGSTAAHYLENLRYGDPRLRLHPYTVATRLAAATSNLAEMWVEEALFGSGFYHGDLHAGNMMYQADAGEPNGLLTVIDFGNSRMLSPHERQAIFRMMLTAALGDGQGFVPEFESILSAEAKALMSPQVRQAFTEKIETILAEHRQAPGGAIALILDAANELGLEVPGPISNFSRSELMLENTLQTLAEHSESHWGNYREKKQNIDEEISKRQAAYDKCLKASIAQLQQAENPDAASIAELQRIQATPFVDLDEQQLKLLATVPVEALAYLTNRLSQIHALRNEPLPDERPPSPTIETAITNVMRRHYGEARRLGGTALSVRVAASMAAGV